jgi:D-sedoheptulose 7-phosphate isomerase
MTDIKNTTFDSVAELLIRCFKSGGKLLLCGNGGSSADCAHITGELVKGFCKKRPLPDDLQKAIGTNKLQMGLPAIDLTANCALISAVNNDLGGDLVYAQQVMAYGRPGDVLIGISTSGNAKNVAMAVKAAKALGLTTVGMTGCGGGALESLCDIMLKSSEKETYLVQEDHLMFYHRLCLRVEEALFTE